jgi:hypothetical protein
MDTNISFLDKTISDYEWNYLNGYCDSKSIDLLNKNFNEYSEDIKVFLVHIYVHFIFH